MSNPTASPYHRAVSIRGAANRDAKFRLILFHHAGGSQSVYQGWEEHFPDDWQIVAVNAPGRGPLFDMDLIGDWDKLVEFFVEVLDPYLDIPFGFFGHSMGGIVAYEVSRQFLTRQKPPTYLAVSGCRAPSSSWWASGSPNKVPTASELCEQVLNAGGTDSSIFDDDELWRIFEPVFENDFGLVSRWCPPKEALPLPVPIVAFGGDQDPLVPSRSLADWERYTQQSFGVYLFPGAHFYLQEHQREIGLILRKMVAIDPTTDSYWAF